MASISTDRGGNRRIFFSGPNRKRKIIYLGGVPMKSARTVKGHVENLAAAPLQGNDPDPETSTWVGSRDDVLYGKLVAVGLAEAAAPAADDKPKGVTLASFIDQYITARMIQKPNTLKNYNSTKRDLLDFFGQERLLTRLPRAIATNGGRIRWAKGLATATIGRTVKRARQFFRAAVRKKLIAESPMQDVKAAPQENKSREYFVTVEETEKIIAACPDAEWRLIVALARYGGLRTPSETFALTWHASIGSGRGCKSSAPRRSAMRGESPGRFPCFPNCGPTWKPFSTRPARHDLSSSAAPVGEFRTCGRNCCGSWTGRG